jgi:hypothetical protein
VRTRQTKLILLWGDAGTFKSSAAKRVKNAVHISPGNTGLWWGDYVPGKHKAVVLDDFDGKWCRPGEIKRLVNHTPLSVDTKGGSRQFTAELVFITSNHPSTGWWKTSQPDQDAINRRITAQFQHVWASVDGERVVYVNMLGDRARVYMHPLHEFFLPGELPNTFYFRVPELDVTQEESDVVKEYFQNTYE